MLSLLLSKTLRAFVCLVTAVTLMGCKEVTVSTFKPATIWMIALDITDSISEQHFLVMRDHMIPQVVLTRLRSREEVHIMPVDTDPEQRVKRIPLTKTAGIDKEVAALFETIRTAIPRPKVYKGTTNIGGVLAYAKRISLKLQEERQWAQARGKALPPAPRIVVNIFSDGQAEGPQTPLPNGPWPAEVTVWFWGIEPPHGAALKKTNMAQSACVSCRLDPDYETSLKKWATTTIGIPEGQVHLVRWSDWETVDQKVFGPRIDRTYQNVALLPRLGITPGGKR